MKAKPLIRLCVFLVIAGFLALMEITTLTGPHVGTTDTYYAMFGGTDGVSGLRSGNPVRVAGVDVGKVTGIDLVSATEAKVTFSANRNQTLTTHTYAIVRYANLLGQRYLALTQSGSTPGAALPAGATIPDARTQPALSLTDLFNGFRPLFSALTPDQVNELSQDIIDVLQGQGSRISDLIARTASLTSNFARRDQVFSSVLDSLTKLLTTVSKHDNELANMVTSLHALTTELHHEGGSIVDSLGAVDQLVGSVGGLFQNLDRHSLRQDVADAASLTNVLARNTPTVKDFIRGFSQAFETFSRISQNGNWINVYVCNITVRTKGTVKTHVKDVLDQIDQGIDASAPNLGLGALLGNVLDGIGLGDTGPLSSLPGVDVPVKLPAGYIGGAQQTGVCQ